MVWDAGIGPSRLTSSSNVNPEVLHRVVKRAIVRVTIIVDLHRVWMRHVAGLHLTLEPTKTLASPARSLRMSLIAQGLRRRRCSAR